MGGLKSGLKNAVKFCSILFAKAVLQQRRGCIILGTPSAILALHMVRWSHAVVNENVVFLVPRDSHVRVHVCDEKAGSRGWDV